MRKADRERAEAIEDLRGTVTHSLVTEDTVNAYHVIGFGRHVGAIGILHPFTCRVDAPNEDAARLKVYEQYEHISGLRLIPLTVCPNCGQWQHVSSGDCLNECRKRGLV